MIRFGAQSVHTLVWGQKSPMMSTGGGESILQEMSVRPWLSMPGQDVGGIGFFRQTTGQPLALPLGGAYTFDTYLTTYSYASGQYSFALQVGLVFAEVLNLHDTSAANMTLSMSFASALNLHDTGAQDRITFISFNERLSIQDTLSTNAVFGLVFPESLLVHDSITSNTPLVAYVVNANNFAVSTYQNFNFNSFMQLGGTYYGASEDGLYELEGDTDSGAAINASLTLGKQDFKSEMLKTLPSVYLGIKASGAMIMKIITDDGAIRMYQLNAINNSSLQTSRLTVGRGVASRYWQFELQNVSGNDFTLDTITFYSVILSRRIGEK
jgi:hypothetical protein